MSDSAENDATFFWDTVTGEPCPRRGNVLCALPWTREHRHAHRKPLGLTVIAGDAPWSVLDAVESLGRVIPPAGGRCICDGARYYPFLRHSECPVHSKFSPPTRVTSPE